MTADAALVVLLEGRPIARLERGGGGRLSLFFDDGYRMNSDATPLSVSMPASVPRHGDATITPWLWGLLPDNDDVLERWGRAFSVSANSPFRLLGTPIGRDCAGAVQFCDASDVEDPTSRPGDRFELNDADIAERLRQLSTDRSGWLGPNVGGQFSLAGAQAKTALHRDESGWGIALGSLPTTTS